MDLVLILSLHVDDFSAGIFLAEPFEINTERLLAKLEKDNFLRPIPTVDLFSAAQAGNIGINARVALQCRPI